MHLSRAREKEGQMYQEIGRTKQDEEENMLSPVCNPLTRGIANTEQIVPVSP